MKNKLKLTIIFSILFTAFVVFVPIGESQTKGKTASEEFKSIKVLKDMPADQMGKVMNQMSASLGVNCNFCHDKDDFAKEGFEHKDIAREMITMTFELNKKYFNGRPEINCNSCHNGKAHPQPSFPLVAAKPAEERPKEPAKKPTAEEILAKYETALGGKTKLEKITSRYIKAQRIEPNGKTIEAEEIWTKGNKSLVKTMYDKFVVSEIFDGTNAWKFGNSDKIELKSDEAEQIKRDSQIFANPNLKQIYSKLEYRAIDKLDGKEVYVVFATTAENKRERLVFDVATGLLIRRSSATPTIFGNFVYQVDYQDYKDFGGVKLPTTIKFAVPNIYWTRKIIDVKNNVNVDDTVFTK